MITIFSPDGLERGFEVWGENRHQGSLRIGYFPSFHAAMRAINLSAEGWIQSRPGRKAVVVSGIEVHLLYTDGKLHGTIHMEQFPVPLHPQPGDRRRSKKVS